VKEAIYKRKDGIIPLYEVLEEWVMGSCLMGTEFQYGMKKKFWRWTVM
jgi:hypothetical protein